MKKFQANYLISDEGNFLKNGIVVAENDGTILQFIDTTDDLIEIAGLSFHNGILIPAFSFSNSNSTDQLQDSDHPLILLVMSLLKGRTSLSILDFIEIAKQIQDEFIEMKIPKIMKAISDALILWTGFVKVGLPGIFLITGADLPNMHFTTRTRIKRIL